MPGPSNAARPVWSLLAIKFSETLGYAVIIPVIPFLGRQLEISGFQIGLVFALYALAQIVSGPFLGAWSDRRGRRPILLLTQVGTILGFVVLLVSQQYWALLLSRVIDGLTGGNTLLLNAQVLDRYEGKARERVLSHLGAAAGVGIIIGPVVGGYLASVNFSLLIWLSITLSTASLVLTYFSLPNTRGHGQTRFFPLKIWQNQSLRTLYTLKFLKEILVNGFVLTLPFYLATRFGFDEFVSGSFVTGLFVCALVYQLTLLARTLAYRPRRTTLLVVTGTQILGLMTLYPGNLAWTIVGGVLFVVGVVIHETLFTVLFGQEKHFEKGVLLGLDQTVSGIGQIIGPVLGYGAITLLGPAGWLASLIAVGGCFLYYAHARLSRSPHAV